MQKKLYNYKGRNGYRVKPSPVCVNCVLDPNSEDSKKYQCRYKYGLLRPFLDHIVGNIWICPRCQSQHLSRDVIARKR